MIRNQRPRILVVDDDPADQHLLQELTVEPGETVPPWLHNVEFVFVSQPLDKVEDYFFYDAVIFDHELKAAQNGYEIARQLHIRRPHLPLMLLTSSKPKTMPRDTREWVDAVAYKYGAAAEHPLDQLMPVARAFLRHITRP